MVLTPIYEADVVIMAQDSACRHQMAEKREELSRKLDTHQRTLNDLEPVKDAGNDTPSQVSPGCGSVRDVGELPDVHGDSGSQKPPTTIVGSSVKRTGETDTESGASS